MKHAIALISLIFLLVLWIIPTVMIYNNYTINFMWMYVPATFLSLFYGAMVDGWYKNK